MKLWKTLAPIVATFVAAGTLEAQNPALNEIYISHAGVDDMEYVEVVGTPGAPVADLMILIVEGDGASAGILDRAWSCPPPVVIPGDGFMVVGDTNVTNVDLDVGPSNTIENGTNTFYLIGANAQVQQQILGLLGSDIDSDGDLVTDIGNMAATGALIIHDLVAVTDGDAGDLTYDGAQVLGPDGPFLPGGVYRTGDFPNPWCTTSFLDFDDVVNLNQPRTPGTANTPFCPQVTIFGGLVHTSLDQAQMQHSGGNLVISNIGSSGCDGVSIDLGEADYHIVQFDAPPASTIPTGAALEITTTGELSGNPDREIWTLRVEDVGAEFGASLDTTNVGTGTLTVEARLNGQVVSSRSYTPPPAPQQIVAVFLPEGCWIDPFWRMLPECWAMIRLASTGPVTIVGNGAVIADEVVLISSNQTETVGFLSQNTMTAADIPTWTIFQEQLGMFEHGHIARGQAEFDASGGTLTVSNIGSSGLDGVSIDLDTPTGGLDAFWADPDPAGTLPVGAQLRVSSRGAGGGASGVPFGDLFLTSGGGGSVQVTADFSPVGSATTLVEVYLDGVLQAAFPGMSGLLATSPGWPGGCGKRPRWDPFPFPCYWLPWPSPLPITISGGPTILGDELRVLAEGATTPFDALESLTIHGTGVPELTLTGEREAVSFGGLQHVSLGQAHMTRGHDHLTISNIGSSGLDGVSIDLGESEYHIIQFDVPPAPALPDGSSMEITTHGVLNGAPHSEIWTLRVEDVGAEFGASLDTTNVGTGTLRVEARLDGQVVSSASYTPPPSPQQIVAVFQPEGCWIDPFWNMDLECWAMIRLASTGPVTVVGQPQVTADEIVLISSNQTRNVGSLSGNEMRGTSIPTFTIFDEALGMFHREHRALGEAQMTTSGGHLTVSNIGSSGLDGVSIDLDEVGGFDVFFEVELSPAGPPGPQLHATSTGSSAGAPAVSLGDLFLTDIGPFIEVTADYSPVGSPTALVEIYLQGQLVFSQSGMTGPLARIPDWPGGCGKRPQWPPFPFPCYWLPWPNPIPITIPGGPTILGDELRVLAEGATVPFDALTSFSILGTDLGQFTITAESSPPDIGTPQCFGVGCPCGNDDPTGGCANSTGSGGRLAGSGSTSVAADDLILDATSLPPNNNGLFYMGDTRVTNPFFDGFQCALGTTWRFLCCIQNSGSAGTMTLGPNIIFNSGGLITPGSTWYFHCWHRDVPGSPCGTGANLTHLLCVNFTP